MPGAVPVTSSAALNNATLPYGLTIARGGLRAILSDPALTAGLNVHRGEIFNAEVGESLQLPVRRSEEHTSELQSLMRTSYAVFCLKKKKRRSQHNTRTT